MTHRTTPKEMAEQLAARKGDAEWEHENDLYNRYDRIGKARPPRSLHVIAREIRGDWVNVNYAAAPYLGAMYQLDKITDMFYEDTADSVVRYFLANATTWRGAKAREIKAELKGMLDHSDSVG